MTQKQPPLVTIIATNGPKFWKGVKDKKMDYLYGGKPNQYGFPVALSGDLAKEMETYATTMQTWIAQCTPEERDEIIKAKPIFLLGKALDTSQINEQLTAMIKKGFQIPFVADAMIGINTEGKVGMKALEMQSGIGYFWELVLLAQASGIDEKEYISDNLREAVRHVRECVGNKKILVIDVDPMRGGTCLDQRGMQVYINNDPQSYPCSIFDLTKNKDGERCFSQKNDDKEEIAVLSLDTYAIACRMTPDDLAALEGICDPTNTKWETFRTTHPQRKDQYTKEFLKTVYQFLTDAGVTWMRHPTRSRMIDKADMPKLADNETTKKMAMSQYRTTDTNIPAGVYYIKPENGNSGSGGGGIYIHLAEGPISFDAIKQQLPDIEADETTIDQFIIQEYIHPYEFTVNIPFIQSALADTLGTSQPSTTHAMKGITEQAIVEIRYIIFPQKTEKGQQPQGYMMARTAPSRTFAQEHVYEQIQKEYSDIDFCGFSHYTQLLLALQSYPNIDDEKKIKIVRAYVAHTMTNLGKIMTAMYEKIQQGRYGDDVQDNQSAYQLMPFGRAVVSKQ
ncbi:MAG: hypothetical protein NZL83_03230 [Candidatus Absconditabacterales bacterium]|nr:hypothetical protein [Candidatus Absconditabacterales bacterium]